MEIPTIFGLISLADERGEVTRLFQAENFKSMDLQHNYVLSVLNYRKGTVRGMHMQVEPHTEKKRLTVTEGSIFDVLIDLRPASKTYGAAYTCLLSAKNPTVLSIPEGFAHGYQTTSSSSRVLYFISGQYSPVHARVFDPLSTLMFPIWPLPVTTISNSDREGAALPFTKMNFYNLRSEF